MNEIIKALETKAEKLREEQRQRIPTIVRKMFGCRPSALPRRMAHHSAKIRRAIGELERTEQHIYRLMDEAAKPAA